MWVTEIPHPHRRIGKIRQQHRSGRSIYVADGISVTYMFWLRVSFGLSNSVTEVTAN
jgi:hypothetical protein